jgi:hypothetical protein
MLTYADALQLDENDLDDSLLHDASSDDEGYGGRGSSRSLKASYSSSLRPHTLVA